MSAVVKMSREVVYLDEKVNLGKRVHKETLHERRGDS